MLPIITSGICDFHAVSCPATVIFNRSAKAPHFVAAALSG